MESSCAGGQSQCSGVGADATNTLFMESTVTAAWRQLLAWHVQTNVSFAGDTTATLLAQNGDGKWNRLSLYSVELWKITEK